MYVYRSKPSSARWMQSFRKTENMLELALVLAKSLGLLDKQAKTIFVCLEKIAGIFPCEIYPNISAVFCGPAVNTVITTRFRLKPDKCWRFIIKRLSMESNRPTISPLSVKVGNYASMWMSQDLLSELSCIFCLVVYFFWFMSVWNLLRALLSQQQLASIKTAA